MPVTRDWFGHPKGLTILFFTQMWAEFSFFGLQALLVYYMTRHLGFTQAQSSVIYGAYGAAAFFTPFLGGLIADRWLGRTPSVVIGGVMMMLGHFGMAFESLLIPALVLVALGNGLFIPPLAVQIGSLYANDDPRQAQAFSAYYMGINLGGLLAPLICGTLGEVYGWHWGFGAAGIGMAIGLAVYLSQLGLLPPEPERTSRRPGARVRAALSAEDWRGLRSLLALVAVVVLFRICYEQNGNVIALWVADQTDRRVLLPGGAAEIPATWFQALNPLLIIVGTPFLMRLWQARARRAGDPNLYHRMAIGCAITGLAMLVMVMAAIRWQALQPPQPVSLWWVTSYFGLLTLGEMLVIPVGLTLVDRLAPARLAAMCMGAWYIAKFLGSILAGVMGAWWGSIPLPFFFAIGMLAVMLAAAILFVMGKRGPHQATSKA